MRTSGLRVGAGLVLLLGAGIVTACAGEAPAGLQTVMPQSRLAADAPQSAHAVGGTVSFSVGFTPKQAPNRRAPDYVSPSTASMEISTDGGNPVIVDVSMYSPNCSPNPNEPGSYICTAQRTLPAGTYTFTVTAYDRSGAHGNVLSTNTTGPVYVKPVGRTTVSIVLEGVAAYVALSLEVSNPPSGTPRTIGLDAAVSDADGNLIVGPAPFKNPVTLTTSDAVHGRLSKLTLNSPADTATVSVAYDGAPVSRIVFSAMASDVPAAHITAVALTPGVQYLYAANQITNTVSVFDLAEPTLTIAPFSGGDLTDPGGAAVDANGKIYVANGGIDGSGGEFLTVYDTQNFNLSLAGNLPGGDAGVAISASGIEYSVNSHSGVIYVYDLVHHVALPPISGGDIDDPWGVAIDAAGRLYVTNVLSMTGVSVAIFDTVHGNAVLPGIAGTTQDYGATLDASGKLYVAEYDGGPAGGAVGIFDTRHGNAALPPITSGVPQPQGGIALDARGRLYVSTSYNTISVFDTLHGNAVLPSLSGNALNQPSGLAIH